MKLPVPSHDVECEILVYFMKMRSMDFAHIPNEGKRSGKILSLMMRLGLQPGFPDYLIFSKPHQPTLAWGGYQGGDYRGVAIEMKKRDDPPSKTRENQKEWQRRLTRCGWRAEICHGSVVAIEMLQELGF